MDIPTCLNWFNEVFYPKIRRRNCHPVLLVMGNTPGHFETFQRENVVVRFFFLPIEKQPCYFELNEAVKKRYKFLLLKDVPSFYQLDNDNKQN